MATDPSQMIMGLLQGAGFGRTVLDNEQQRAQIGLMSQQQMEATARATTLQAQAANNVQYQQAVAAYSANPTPQALARLQAQFPDHADALAKSYESMDAPVRQNIQTQLGELFHGAQSGDHELVSGNITRIRDAERARGMDTSEADHILGMLDDPQQREAGMRAVTAFAQAHLAGSGASTIVNTLAPHHDDYTINSTRFSGDSNQPLATAPEPIRMVPVAPGGSLVPTQGGRVVGGGAITPGSAPAGMTGTTGGAATPGANTGSARIMGWTPRGSENSNASVDNKIAMISRVAGVDADTPLTRDQFVSLDMTQNEGAPAGRNNPGNIRSRDGSGFANYLTPQAGINAMRATLARRYAQGARTIRDAVEGRVAGNQPSNPATPAAPTTVGGVSVDPSGVIHGPPVQHDPPQGYRWSADGSRQEFIPGGPADPATANRTNAPVVFRQEQQLRNQFLAQPQVHNFTTQRTSFRNMYDTVHAPPSAQADIALIFNYMKLLDPTSVVREGEFATAQNAGSVDQSVWNMYNRAVSGQRLTPEQRQNMLRTGFTYYSNARNAYNNTAQQYRDLASGYDGVRPDFVARTYTPTPEDRGTRTGSSAPATPSGPVHYNLSPAQAQRLPIGAHFTAPGDPPNTFRTRR